jgi:hypothetical protein
VVADPPSESDIVTTPPPGAPPPGTPSGGPNTGAEDFFIYPQNGQSDAQQATDRYECHHWASTQTGFDPAQPSGGVPPQQASQKRADYRRAMSACLEAK